MTAAAATTTSPAPAAGRRRWLELDLAVIAVAAITFAVSALGTPPAGLVALAAALALLVGGWFALRRAALADGRAWIALGAVLVVVGLIGSLASPAFATVQLVVLPIAWLIAPSARSAVVLNVLIVLAVGVGYAANSTALFALGTEGLSLAFSLAMGRWILLIERRSEERRVLVDRLTAAQAEVAALGREAGAAAERERLARELHDTLTQSLAGVVMLAERARARHAGDDALAMLEDAARQALGEARGLVAASAGVPLEGGLAAALETLAARFRRETGLAVRTDVAADVPRGLEVVLLRCAQEGLANVRKHAGARSVAVAVLTEGDDAVLTVTDDGRGPADGQGFGLTGMRDRVGLVGGDAELVPGSGGGAVLRVRVPRTAPVPA